MKNLISLFILLALAFNANAQESSSLPTHRMAFAMGFNYLFPQSENDLNIDAKEAGFNGSFTYTLDYGKIGIQLSPFVKLNVAEDFEGMKQYYKDKNSTLTSYDGGTYLSSGMSVGLQFTLIDNGKLPILRTYLHYGMSGVRVPEVLLSYDSEAGSATVRSDGGLAFGSNINLGINCDVFESNNTIYSIKVGLMNEHVNVAIPTTTFADITTRSTEIFPWRSLSAYINLAIAFDMQ
jgi:hypothetical protein